MIIGSGVKGKRQNRYVINGMRLDQRFGDPMRNAVKVGLQLLVQADNRGLQVLTYVEAGNQQAAAGHGGGVNKLDPGQFIEQFFHGNGNPLLYLLGGSAWH